MAEKRGEESQGWLECQGASLSQKARYELETSPARRRLPARLFLCEDERHEKEVNKRKDGKRPELAD
jgi:hypothetical protein